MRLFAAAALLALSVAACAREAPAPATPATSATTTQAPVAAAAPEASATPKATAEQATRSQESVAPEITSTDSAVQALERIAALPASAQLPAGSWKAGTHYVPVVPAMATTVPPGQVEVLEFFWYGCPHCAALDPFLESFRKNKPANVTLVRVPVQWSAPHKSHARLYYALQSLGKLDELHPKVFQAVQRDPKLLTSTDDNEALRLQTTFATSNGIDADAFQKAWRDSPAMTASLNLGLELEKRYSQYISGVPALIVNGKYYTDVDLVGGDRGKLVQLLGDLSAAETRR